MAALMTRGKLTDRYAANGGSSSLLVYGVGAMFSAVSLGSAC
jgi:hypothetical protein